MAELSSEMKTKRKRKRMENSTKTKHLNLIRFSSTDVCTVYMDTEVNQLRMRIPDSIWIEIRFFLIRFNSI